MGTDSLHNLKEPLSKTRVSCAHRHKPTYASSRLLRKLKRLGTRRALHSNGIRTQELKYYRNKPSRNEFEGANRFCFAEKRKQRRAGWWGSQKMHSETHTVTPRARALNILHNAVPPRRAGMNAANVYTRTHTASLPKEAYFNYNGCHGYFNSIIAPSSLTTPTPHH